MRTSPAPIDPNGPSHTQLTLFTPDEQRNTCSSADILTYTTHSTAVREDTVNPYRDSPFGVYQRMSSKRKGTYGEHIFEEFATRRGHHVSKALTSDHDRIVDGVKVEVKTSFLWTGTDDFRWSQIRRDQDYDVLVFLAVWPQRIDFYAATKADALRHLDVVDSQGRRTHNQHGGITADSGTLWVSGLPENIEWFRPLDEVLFLPHAADSGALSLPAAA